MIETVTLLSNPKKKVPKDAASEIIRLIESAGVRKIIVSPDVIDEIGFSEKAVFADGEELFGGSELAVVMGGDGSVLSAARKAAKFGVPIASINFGHLGYLCELEYSEREYIVDMIRNGFRCEERMMLDVEVSGRDDIDLLPCLNDVVLTNGPISRISHFGLWCSGTEVAKYSADGIVICTPTGSSAYSLSAGGPLIYQTMDCICATPICPHSMLMRPIVFDRDARIEIKDLYCRENRMFITVDGRDNIEVFPGDTITIKRSRYKTKLARIKNRSFVDVLHGKMTENSSRNM